MEWLLKAFVKITVCVLQTCGLEMNELKSADLETFLGEGGSDSYLTGPVQVLHVLCEVVQCQEGVGVSRSTVAQPVPLLQQPILPDHISALVGVTEILFLPEHL